MYNTCVHIIFMRMLILQYSFKTLLYTSVSYYTVCAPVRGDNPRALASGLSPVQTHKTYNNLLITPACICTLCIARYLMLNIGSMIGAITEQVLQKRINGLDC